MEGLYTITVFIAGLLLRFGIPIGITVLVVWALKKLDARWQSEANQMPTVAVARNPGCWNVKACTEQGKATCIAYAHPEIPCWQHFRKSNGELKENCLGCEIFHQAPAPVRIHA